MTSRQLHNIIRNMSPAQLSRLNEHIELQRTVAIMTGKRINTDLLHFVQADVAGLHPRMIEKRHTHPRNGKCIVRRIDG